MDLGTNKDIVPELPISNEGIDCYMHNPRNSNYLDFVNNEIPDDISDNSTGRDEQFGAANVVPASTFQNNRPLNMDFSSKINFPIDHPFGYLRQNIDELLHVGTEKTCIIPDWEYFEDTIQLRVAPCPSNLPELNKSVIKNPKMRRTCKHRRRKFAKKAEEHYFSPRIFTNSLNTADRTNDVKLCVKNFTYHGPVNIFVDVSEFDTVESWYAECAQKTNLPQHVLGIFCPWLNTADYANAGIISQLIDNATDSTNIPIILEIKAAFRENLLSQSPLIIFALKYKGSLEDFEFRKKMEFGTFFKMLQNIAAFHNVKEFVYQGRVIQPTDTPEKLGLCAFDMIEAVVKE